MYKTNSKCSRMMSVNLRRHSLSSFVFGEGDTVPINQNPSKSFNINPDTGRPMSEISALLRSESAAEQMALFSQLQDYKSEFLPAGMSDDEAIRFAVPRYIQLPSQLAEFQAQVRANVDFKKFEDEKAKIESDKAAMEAASSAADSASSVSVSA